MTSLLCNPSEMLLAYSPEFVTHPYFRCASYCILFISTLYLYGGLNRQDIQSVRRRIFSASISCLLILLDTITFVRRPNAKGLSLTLLELSRVHLKLEGLGTALFVPSSVTLLLFMGPLFSEYRARYYYRASDWLRECYYTLDWRWLRTVIVAPCVEELIFRGCILFHLKRELKSCCSLCLASAGFFAVSHFHHVFEKIHAGYSWKSAIKSCTAQVLLTAFFGTYSTFIVLRTGNLLAACMVHAICNQFGLPDLRAEIHLAEMRDGARGKVLYLAILVAGLFGWMLLILPATSPHLFSNNSPFCYT